MDLRQLASLALLAGLAACSGGSGSDLAPATGQQVTFSVATHAAAPALAGSPMFAAAPDTLAVNGDTLVYDSITVVLRKIDLHRVNTSTACEQDTEDGMGSTAIASSDSEGDMHEGEHDGHEDDCEAVRSGPIALDLPLGAGTSREFSVTVDTGTYDRVRFQIHRLTSSVADDSLSQARPELAGISIRADGKFKGQPFTYVTDLTANQIDSLPPLVVGAKGPVNLTLFVDIHTWFLDQSGTMLIDPASALSGQPNETLVRDNIRASFRTFEDENHDGEDDHHEESHD